MNTAVQHVLAYIQPLTREQYQAGEFPNFLHYNYSQPQISHMPVGAASLPDRAAPPSPGTYWWVLWPSQLFCIYSASCESQWVLGPSPVGPPPKPSPPHTCHWMLMTTSWSAHSPSSHTHQWELQPTRESPKFPYQSHSQPWVLCVGGCFTPAWHGLSVILALAVECCSLV